MGCDHTAGKAFAFRHISIHAPQWGATTLFKGASGTVQFQSTHPSGVRPRLPPTCSTPLSFQSTHPSGVRLAWRRNPAGRGSISIHAPQWGATSIGRPYPRLLIYFNPRTPVGCDVRAGRDRMEQADFNPRTPVGCDVAYPKVRTIVFDISIHAPQWGATGRSQSAMSLIQISIHAPQWGATGRIRLGVMLLIHFNPRTPVGCDFAPLVILASGIPISIHAPQWGATEIVRRLPETVFISIHAPQWGATRNEWHHHNPQSHFNPRTPVGCDRRHATLMIV